MQLRRLARRQTAALMNDDEREADLAARRERRAEATSAETPTERTDRLAARRERRAEATSAETPTERTDRLAAARQQRDDEQEITHDWWPKVDHDLPYDPSSLPRPLTDEQFRDIYESFEKKSFDELCCAACDRMVISKAVAH